MARLLAVAATAIAVSPVLAYPAAGGPAAQSVSRVVSCATAERAVQFSAFATNPALREAVVGINTGNPQVSNPLFWLDTKHNGYTVGDGCRAARKRLAFTHRGLTSARVSRAGDNRSSTVYCSAPRRVRLRFHIDIGSSGKPAAAKVEVWTQPAKRTARRHPIGYVAWSSERSVTYYRSSACTSQ
jgi:hypothetical protein